MQALWDRMTRELDIFLGRIIAWQGFSEKWDRYYCRFAPPVVAVGTTVGILIGFLYAGEPVGLAVALSAAIGVGVYVALRLALRSLRRWQ